MSGKKAIAGTVSSGYTLRHGKVIPEGSVVVITAHDKGRKEYKVRNSAGKVKTYSYTDFTLFTTVNPDVVVLHERTILTNVTEGCTDDV